MSEGAVDAGADPQARIRHRVANTFHFLASLARMRAQRGADASPAQALAWMADTIADLGSLERFVREDQADLQAFLTYMTSVWRDRFRRRNLQVVLDVCPLTLSESTAPTVALAALELVANAAGHTFMGDEPPQVRLSVQPAEDGHVLAVTDNGFGMASPRDTFGLWLVGQLSRQLRGELTLSTEGDATLTFRA